MRALTVLLGTFAVLSSIAGCGDEPMQPASEGMTVLTGDGQRGTPGALLRDSISIVVTDPRGRPVAGVPVSFGATGSGAAIPAVDTTDTDGVARTTWRLSLAEGEQALTATAPGRDPATVRATGKAFHAVALGVGGNESACAIDADGRAWCWANQPDTPPAGPTLVAGDLSFTALSGGYGYMCGLTTDGSAYCWHPLSDAPALVAGMPPLVSIDADQTGETGLDVCGLTAAGALYCRGATLDADGQIVRNTSPTEIAPGFQFKEVTYTSNQICGLDLTGVGYCWGNNRLVTGTGALGIGPGGDDYYATPQPVAGGLQFTNITNGGFGTCGHSSDGNVYCWGDINAGIFPEPNLRFPTVPTITTVPKLETTRITYIRGYGRTAGGRIYWWGKVPLEATGPWADGAEPLPDGSADGVIFTEIDGTQAPCGLSSTGGVYCWRFPNWPQVEWRLEAVPAPE